MRDHLGRTIDYLRVSVTELCNLRCRYCMPADGVCKRTHREMMTEEELLRAVRAAASLGIQKVRITGGEPLVKKNILSIAEHIAQTPGIAEVCLTTNGVLLPDLAKPLADAGVSRVNISLDTLDAGRYAFISRIGRLSDALRGLDAALSAGFAQVKLNTVLIGGFNEDEVERIAGLTRDRPLDVRFIELMPLYDSGDFGEEAFIGCDTVLERLPELAPEAPDGGVARLYRLPGAKGRVGLISPLSAHFCGRCNRLRLTADGKIKPCLHAPLEYSLRGLDEEGMRAVLLRALDEKPAEHPALSARQRSLAMRNMNEIGG